MVPAVGSEKLNHFLLPMSHKLVLSPIDRGMLLLILGALLLSGLFYIAGNSRGTRAFGCMTFVFVGLLGILAAYARS